MSEPLPFLPRAVGLHPPAHAPAYRSTALRSPRIPPVALPPMATELTGPVFGHDLIGPDDHDLTVNSRTNGTPIGERIIVHGRVTDENGRPVAKALVEVWQANAAGRYRHENDRTAAPLDPHFAGWGRVMTDEAGGFAFRTIRPGAYPWRNAANSWRPAHIHFSLFGHAFAQRLITQMYFEGDPLIPLCPIANSIPDRAALDRLVARLDMDSAIPFDCLAYRFDIVLRGRRASVFENRPEGT